MHLNSTLKHASSSAELFFASYSILVPAIAFHLLQFSYAMSFDAFYGQLMHFAVILILADFVA